MGCWALIAGASPATGPTRYSSPLASGAGDSPSPPPRRRRPRPSPKVNGSPSSAAGRQKKPSVAEVQRAIGMTDGFDGNPSSSSPSPSSNSSPFMELLSSTPIGQPESSAERKLREAAEWVVDRTENQARSGQRILLVVCLKILPVWLLLLLIASGVLKLPFDVPFIDDLIS